MSGSVHGPNALLATGGCTSPTTQRIDPQRGDFPSEEEYLRAVQIWSLEEYRRGHKLAVLGMSDALMEEILLMTQEPKKTMKAGGSE